MTVVSFQRPEDGAPDMPHSLEAEKQLLGCLLVNNDAYARVQAFLEAAHFYFEPHRRIYAAIASFRANDRLADPVTLATFFEGDATLAPVGGPSYLVGLAAGAASILDTEAYGRTVYDLALRREMIGVAEAMLKQARHPDCAKTVPALVEDAEASLMGLLDGGERETRRALPMRRVMAQAIDGIVAAQEGRSVGLKTGIADLDAVLTGLARGDYVVIAGRPSMGKSALAGQIALNAARAGEPVVVFSFEMSAEAMGQRFLSEASGVPYFVMPQQGRVDATTFAGLVAKQSEMSDLPLWLVQASGMTAAAIHAECRRLRRRYGRLGLIVVDYLQLVRPESTYRGNMVAETTEISRALLALAKRMDCPLIALSQLNREVEKRPDQTPMKADLRESGAIEQDADTILLMYRKEYYLRQKEPQPGSAEYPAWEAQMNECRDRLDIIVAKQRRGPETRVQTSYIAATGRIGWKPLASVPADPLGDLWEGRT